MEFADGQFYTGQQLAMDGISQSAQAEGRNLGLLNFSRIGADYVYAGADVRAWLEASRAGGRGQAGKASSGGRAATYGSAAERWEAAVAEKMSSGRMSKQKAVSAVVKEDPQLQQAYISEYNEQHAAARTRR